VPFERRIASGNPSPGRRAPAAFFWVLILNLQEDDLMTVAVHSLGLGTVKMIAEYLEHALQFEKMAAEATDPQLKESLGKQAVAYRKLATERAERLNLPPPPQSS
jgi:hypothetical protein